MLDLPAGVLGHSCRCLYLVRILVMVCSEAKKVKNFEGYFACPHGYVYSLKLKKPARLKPRKNDGRYYVLSLYKNKKKHIRYVHRIIAETFIGDIPKGYHVDHVNGDIYNNSVDNLNIVTACENLKRQAHRNPHKYIKKDKRTNAYQGIFYVHGIGNISAAWGRDFDDVKRRFIEAYYEWHGKEPRFSE